MKVRTLESLTMPQGEIPAGTIITIPEQLAGRLQGKVEPIADRAESELQNEISSMFDVFGKKDPGGECWNWIKTNSPELWKNHMVALRGIDEACNEHDAGKIKTAMDSAKATFDDCLKSFRSTEGSF